MSQKVRVHLESDVRQELEALCRQSVVPAGKVRRARILLLTDEDHQDRRRPNWQVAEIVGCGEKTMARVRRQFVEQGLKPTLERKPRSSPGTKPKFDGEAEAKLIALSCSQPPEGRERWTMQLLADEACRLQIVTSVCAETVRKCLKKNRLKPWRTRRFCIPDRDRPRFVAHMEKVLDVSQEEYDEEHPLVTMDEASKQIVADVEPALPMTPGQPRREDPHYQREGTRALFLFFDPLRGWRRVSSRDSRTRRDWALEIRRLLDEDSPYAKRLTLVCDNLNTHDIASLYATFDAVTAGRLARRLRLVHTPKNGSWLNLAEMELSVLSRQCIGRRFGSPLEMEEAMRAWQAERNASGVPARWRFTTAEARIKLRTLYPEPVV